MLCQVARVIGVLAIACSLGLAQGNSVPSASSTVTNAYVGTGLSLFGVNQPPGNIIGYAIHHDGSAIKLFERRFSAQVESMVVSTGHLYANDGRHVTTFLRGNNGLLTFSSSFDAAARDADPQEAEIGELTLDRTSHTLYVSNLTDPDIGAVYDAYSTGNRKPTFLATTANNVNYGGRLRFSHDNANAYTVVCVMADWEFVGFHRHADGRLSAFVPSIQVPPVPSDDTLCPSQIASSAKGFMAVAYGRVAPGPQFIATYRENADGTLDLVANSEIQTKLTQINGLWFEPKGAFLAAVGEGGLQVFRMSATGKLSNVAGPRSAGIHFLDVKWDNDGHVIAVATTGLYIYSLRNGELLRAPGSPHPVAHGLSLATVSVP